MTRFFVRHPVATWMIFTAAVVLGAYALPRLQIEAIPEINLPTLTVETVWNGASPQAVQRSITIPIEEAARKVHSVERVKSTSSPGRSQVEIQFRRSANIDFARVDLNEQLGTVRRSLPLNAGQPQILPYVPDEFQTEDFFTFSLESTLNPNTLRELAESWVLPHLLALDGVADARILGGARSLVKIYLDRQQLELYGITPDAVFAALDRLDEFRGAGVVVQSGSERVVALRERVSYARIEQAVVAERGGRLFTLGMLGELRHDFEDPVYFVRTNGQNVIQIAVDKRSGANTVGVSRTLRHALPEIQGNAPFQVTFDIDADQGEELEAKLRELVYRSFVILALLFVMLAVSLKQLRLTAIIVGSIVLGVVISLSLFYFLRISVNFITISGLTVCFGMILDNSILVLDAIHHKVAALERAQRAGLSRKAKLAVAREMIVSGTREVLSPALATTLTTIVAFASFIFLSGRLALFYVPLGVAVSTAMLASLFVAFGWVPMMAQTTWAAPLVRRSEDGPNDVADAKELSRFSDDVVDLEARPPLAERILAWNQRLWWLSLPLLAALLVWGGFVYKNKVKKGGFWRLPDQEELILFMRLPPGTDIRMTAETLWSFENALLPIREGATMRSTTWGNQGFMRVSFDDDLLKTETPLHYRAILTDKADKLAGAAIYIAGFSDTPYINGNFMGSALNSLVKITGYNSRRLQGIGETALKQVERNRRVRHARITTDSRFGRAAQEEVVINVHRDRLATHGLSVVEVVRHLRRLLGVDTPWNMLIDGDNERVQLSFYDSMSLEYSDAVQTLITTPSGRKVRIADVVSVETMPLSESITREDQRYTMYLNWEYVGTDQMRKAYLTNLIESLDLPYGYDAEESRREFFTEEEEEELTLAIILAVVSIYMVLAAVFESLWLPLLVLISLPTALVGVFLAFWWTGSDFDSSARIGLILLFGIAVSNGILLISRFRTEATLVLKARLGFNPSAKSALFPGSSKECGGSELWRLPPGERSGALHRALARATRVRFRSIFLTSGTTIVGLVPLLIHFRETEDKDIWENLALASIGGLTSSTILILLTLPALYYFCVRLNWMSRAMWQRIRREKVNAGVRP
jgi:HAE1 family hydrophobic/amphiphilic exporter-1